jgi:hypothetical protein
LATLDELSALIEEPTLVIGELTQEARTQLAGDHNTRLARAAAGVRRAGYLAELGWRQARSGDPGDPHVIDALYVS